MILIGFHIGVSADRDPHLLPDKTRGDCHHAFSIDSARSGFAEFVQEGQAIVDRAKLDLDLAPFDRDARLEPRATHGADAARSPFDRAPAAGRVDHKAGGSSFAPRKPGAPASKGGFKPQRPRPGGFTR
jgi:hypothetical protein